MHIRTLLQAFFKFASSCVLPAKLHQCHVPPKGISQARTHTKGPHQGQFSEAAVTFKQPCTYKNETSFLLTRYFCKTLPSWNKQWKLMHRKCLEQTGAQLSFDLSTDFRCNSQYLQHDNLQRKYYSSSSVWKLILDKAMLKALLKTEFSAVHLCVMLQLPAHFQTSAYVQNTAQSTNTTWVLPRKYILQDSCTTTPEIQHPCKEAGLRIPTNKAIRFLLS